MKPRLFLFLSLTVNGWGGQLPCLAQKSDAYAVWFLPAAHLRTADSTVFALQPGWNPQLAIGLLYANSTVNVLRWLDINLGYLFLALPEPNRDESTLMNGVTLKFQVKKGWIQNQNLIWNRFRTIRDSDHFDRNRLRVGHQLTIRRLKFSPYAYEEFWFYFGSKSITRNRVGLGVQFAPAPRLSFDFLYTRQWDRSDGNTTVLFFRSAVLGR